MSLSDAQQMDAENQKLSHAVAQAVDKLNEVIALAIRGGLSVAVETVDASVPGDNAVRPVVQVHCYLTIQYS